MIPVNCQWKVLPSVSISSTLAPIMASVARVAFKISDSNHRLRILSAGDVINSTNVVNSVPREMDRSPSCDNE